MNAPDVNFEERTAAAIRTLWGCVLVLTVFLLLTSGLAAWGFINEGNDKSEIRTIVQKQDASINSPTHGKDIAVWCGAINAGRAYDAAFVSHVTQGKVKYSLGLLPCGSIVQESAKSTKTH